MTPIRHPAEYVLIAERGCTHLRSVSAHLHLLRLPPHIPVPDDYQRVDELFGKSVYKDDGRLKPQYMSYRRYLDMQYFRDIDS